MKFLSLNNLKTGGSNSTNNSIDKIKKLHEVDNSKTSDNTQPELLRNKLEFEQHDRIKKYEFEGDEEDITNNEVPRIIQNKIPKPENFASNYRKKEIHNRLYEVLYSF